MHFVNKNVPAKQNETFIWGKKIPPKRDPGLTDFNFSIEFFYPHFAGLSCLHISSPLFVSSSSEPSNSKEIFGQSFNIVLKNEFLEHFPTTFFPFRKTFIPIFRSV